MSLQSVVRGMLQEDAQAFRRIMLNPYSQFYDAQRRPYLGARFLPERRVPNNEYVDGDIKWRTVVALDASRYSPPIPRGNAIVGKMSVSLSEQDAEAMFTAEDYDNALELRKFATMSNQNEGNPDMQGAELVGNWFDAQINRALIEKIEKMRWEAIVDAMVPLRGANGYAEDVALPNPAGHRVNATQDWTDPTDNPLDDIHAMADTADAAGYELGALIAGRPVITALLNHPKVQAAVGGYINVSGGALVGSTARLDREALNNYLVRENLPPILEYNLRYRTNTTAPYFLKRNVMVGLALTGRDQTIDLGDDAPMPSIDLENTLGYVGIGRAAGESVPGRASWQEYRGDKPPALIAQAWQTSFPVIQNPDGVFAILEITTS